MDSVSWGASVVAACLIPIMNAMPTRIPVTGICGLTASALAIVLWAAEQLTGLWVFEVLAIPAKLTLLAAPFLFLPDLSAFLHGRPRVALSLGGALVAVTLVAMLAYLPWREAFTEHFSNAAYRWYFDGMPQKFHGHYGDFAEWQRRWTRRVPHAIEVGLVVSYFGSIVTACTLRRLGQASGAAIATLGYALLLLVPMFTGLIAWDYDIFLMGIVFDSISMNLSPMLFWYAGDSSIFLYAFMLIFFGVSGAFFEIAPRTAAR